jgi:cytochrome c-type biogenesis protein CcmH/NrfG
VAAKKALAFAGQGDLEAAVLEASRGLERWPSNPDSRYVLAFVMEKEGRLDAAAAQLDTLLSQYPGDSGARDLRARIEAARRGPQPEAGGVSREAPEQPKTNRTRVLP